MSSKIELTMLYHLLDKTTLSIRLVEIRYEIRTIVCGFHTRVFENCPPYWTLSYTRGSPSPIVTIAINAFSTLIRENLHHALLESRDTYPKNASNHTSLHTLNVDRCHSA